MTDSTKYTLTGKTRFRLHRPWLIFKPVVLLQVEVDYLYVEHPNQGRGSPVQHEAKVWRDATFNEAIDLGFDTTKLCQPRWLNAIGTTSVRLDGKYQCERYYTMFGYDDRARVKVRLVYSFTHKGKLESYKLWEYATAEHMTSLSMQENT